MLCRWEQLSCPVSHVSSDSAYLVANTLTLTFTQTEKYEESCYQDKRQTGQLDCSIEFMESTWLGKPVVGGKWYLGDWIRICGR